MQPKWHDVSQNSDEWFGLRLGKTTASKFSTFMANAGKAFASPAKDYALGIALEQITGKKSVNSFRNAHMDRGHEQEPLARMLYEDEHFVSVSNGGFFDCGDYGASPDGLVGNDGMVEMKSVIAKVHYATIRRAAPDPSYKWQLLGHLDCSGRDWVDFASYCADFPEHQQLVTYRVYRNSYLDDLCELQTRRAEFLELVALRYREIA